MKTFQYIFLIFISVTFSQEAFAQSNLDIFFKNDAQYQDVLVSRVLSADTIELESGEYIKLIGLKAPYTRRRNKEIERDKYGFVIEPPRDPTTPIEEQSFEFARELLEGQKVRLEFDVEKKDSDHKTLAYVFILKNNILANTEILRQGFAYLQLSPPNSKYAQQLKNAYKEASKEQRGLQSK